MVKKLELEALTAEVASLGALLSTRTVEEDPIGFFQYSQRRDEIQGKINALGAAPELEASIALFFAGAPVTGSRGIRANFAGKAVAIFQDLVSKRFAAQELGEIGRRGRVPLRANSELMLTDVVRGSFGLLLSEAVENEPLAETQLKTVLDSVVESIDIATDPDSQRFEELLEDIDARYLRSLGEFFELLDEEHATIRLVEGNSDQQFDAVQLHRARVRTGAARIDESEDEQMQGVLYLLPAHRKFELVLDSGESIWGTVSREFATAHLEALRAVSEVVGHKWTVNTSVRTVTRPNSEPRVTHRLTGLIARVN